MRVEQQKAYIIHTRPFRDTSLLIDCYTQNFGRICLIAKGARSIKNRQRSLLQPFQLLSISWQGRGNLKTMIGVEAIGSPHTLKSHFLYSALYINELMLYLLAAEDVSDFLFDRYHSFLLLLEQQMPLEPELRRFELSFLQELGYGIDFYSDEHTGEPISENKEYVYFSGQGFVDASILSNDGAILFSGSALREIANNDFSNADTLKLTKKLTRLSIENLLEGKTLKSREFFKQIAAQKVSE